MVYLVHFTGCAETVDAEASDEREEIERLLAKVETALAWLDPNDLAGVAQEGARRDRT